MGALVVRAGALGDVLLLRPAVAGLREAGHTVTLLAPASSGPALIGPGPGEAQALVAWDRPELAELLVGEPPGEGGGPRTLAGFDLVLAYTRNRPLIEGLRRLNEKVVARDPQPPANGPHASAWLAAALAEAGLKVPAAPPPLLSPTPEETAAAAEWTGRLPPRFVAVHPGSGSAVKNWPTERFAELMAGWSGPFLLVEGPADAEAASSLRALPGAVVARGLPARVLGALLAQAGLFVGHDSGVSHLAAAWGAPSVVLFGPTEPGLWAPVGPQVRVVRAPLSRLDRLSVDTVRAAADGLRR